MKKSQKQAIAIGAGAALAAAAAGIYFFGGKRGAKNRKKVSAWAEKAKREALAELRKVKTVSKQSYNKTVDEVMKRYKQAKRLDPAELTALASELKSHWNSISKELGKAGSKIRRVARKPAKKKSARKKI